MLLHLWGKVSNLCFQHLLKYKSALKAKESPTENCNYFSLLRKACKPIVFKKNKTKPKCVCYVLTNDFYYSAVHLHSGLRNKRTTEWDESLSYKSLFRMTIFKQLMWNFLQLMKKQKQKRVSPGTSKMLLMKWNNNQATVGLHFEIKTFSFVCHRLVHNTRTWLLH